MAKDTLVTFNENVDTYVRGDVVGLDADELKRVDAYAKRWNIEKPYSKGAKDVDTTATDTTDTTATTPNDSKTARAAMASQGDVESDNTEEIKTRTATKPEGKGGEQAAMTEGEVVNPDKADEPANNTVNPGGDTSLSEPASEDEANVANTNEAEKTAAAQELPPVTDQPVTPEGDKPKTGTKTTSNKR